eukprot:6019339-Pyramimonas_sp.AAC.1
MSAHLPTATSMFACAPEVKQARATGIDQSARGRVGHATAAWLQAAGHGPRAAERRGDPEGRQEKEEDETRGKDDRPGQSPPSSLSRPPSSFLQCPPSFLLPTPSSDPPPHLPHHSSSLLFLLSSSS